MSLKRSTRQLMRLNVKQKLKKDAGGRIVRGVIAKAMRRDKSQEGSKKYRRRILETHERNKIKQ